MYEKHYDDCGNDWSGLGKDYAWTDGFDDDIGYDDYDNTDHFDAHWFG